MDRFYNSCRKAYTIIVLLKNIIFRKKYYKLKFVAKYDDNGVKRWYYDFKHWGFSHNNLEMVAGADYLCEYYAEGKDEVTIDVIASKYVDVKAAAKYDFYEGIKQKGKPIDRLLEGRTYQFLEHDENNNITINYFWICPVTLFVLGRYPNCLYIKKQCQIKSIKSLKK